MKSIILDEGDNGWTLTTFSNGKRSLLIFETLEEALEVTLLKAREKTDARTV